MHCCLLLAFSIYLDESLLCFIAIGTVHSCRRRAPCVGGFLVFVRFVRPLPLIFAETPEALDENREALCQAGGAVFRAYIDNEWRLT